MAGRKQKKPFTDLKKLGFTLQADDSFAFCVSPEYANNVPKDHQDKFRFKWRVEELVLSRCKNEFETTKLRLSGDICVISDLIRAELCKRYPSARKVEFRESKEKSGTWCFVEFVESKGDDQTRGLASFRFMFIPNEQMISICVGDSFFFGGAVPPDFFRQLSRLLADAVSFTKLDRLNVHEAGTNLLDFAASMLPIVETESFNQLPHLQGKMDPMVYYRGSYVIVNVGSYNNLEGVGLVDVPVQILENRLLLHDNDQGESVIIASDQTRAKEFLKEKVESGNTDLSILRRVLLVPEVASGVSPGWLADAIRKEPSNPLFLSAFSQVLMKTGDFESSLKVLSCLVRELDKDVDDLDSLESMSFVVPSLIAECWENLDPKKAIICWKRILGAHSDSAHVLGRLAHCYGMTGDKEEELRILKSIVGRASNLKDASDSHYWLARRYAEGHKNLIDAIEQAKLALHKNPQHYDAACLLADLLLGNDRPLESIQVLDRISKSNTLSSEDIGRISLQIGRIWLENLQRPDMARLHFERALAIDGKNLEAMSYLEQVLRELKDSDKLVEILNAQYQVLAENGATDRLGRLKEEIAKVYTGDLGQIESAIELYLDSPSGIGVLEPEDLASVLGFNLDNVNWHALYEALKQSIKGLSNKRDRAQIHVALGKICLQKLKDSSAATRHFERAVKDGWIDSSSFEVLCEGLQAERSPKKLIEVLLLRLSQIPAAQKPDLIRYVVLVGEGLSDEQVDDLLIQLVSLEPSDKKELFKRFDSYGEKGDLGRIKALLNMTLSTLENEVSNGAWIDLAIENANRSSQMFKYPLLDEMYKLRLKYSEEELPIINSAIECLKHSENAGLLKFYIERSLDLNHIPPIDESMLEDCVEDERYRAKFYDLSADKMTLKERKAEFLKIASNIYKKIEGADLEVERCLGHYCHLVPVKPEVLAELRTIVDASGNWDLFVGVLKKQANFTEELEWKYLLWDEVADVMWSKLGQVHESVNALREAIKVSPDVESSRFKLIELLNVVGFKELEKNELRSYLADEACISNIANLKSLMKRMLIHYKMGDDIETFILSHIAHFSERGEHDQAGSLSDLLVEYGFGSQHLKRVSYAGAIARGDIISASDLLVSMLSDLADHRDVEQVLTHAKNVLESQNTDVIWDNLLSHVAGKIQSLPAGRDKIQLESNLQIGIQLFSSDEYNEIALACLVQVRNEDANEARMWVPLYLLMREYSAEQEIKEFLKEILPLIEEKPSSVSGYPVTIESLKAEFAKLVEAIGDEEDLADQAFLNSTGIQSKAAGSEYGSVAISPSPVGTFEGPTVDKNKPLVGNPIYPPFEALALLANEEGAVEVTVSKADLGVSPFQPDVNSLVSRQRAQIDWRECVRSREIPEGFASLILNSAFSSAIEKHIALQVAALVSGEMEVLEDWHWKIWRSPDQFGYSRSGKDRYPSDMNPKLLYGPLHRTIIYLGPAYVQLYKHRFRQDYLCRKLTVSSEKLGEHIKPLDWAHPIFRETSLAHYRETMQKQKFRPFDARGLGRRIFFEGSTRSLYIDVSYYHSKPPSIIFHRVYGLLWSIKLQYYVPMHLDPTRHLYSGYMQMKGSLEGGGLGWLKNIVASSGDPVVQALAVVDRSELRRQVDRVGEVSPEHMVTLWTTLHEHIYRLLLAETLDVVGLFEAITGKDYLEEKKLKPLEIFNESPFIAGLIEYLTHLKL